MKALVSIILPVFNGAKTIEKAIESVRSLDYPYWELLCINDGSTDETSGILNKYDDPRIRVFSQPNQGVSAARNAGLNEMKGQFFCFLDADDQLTKNSLSSRLGCFDDPEVEFVDGSVEFFDDQTNASMGTSHRHFNGNPFQALLELDENCFFGPTWMIRKKADKVYQFKEGLSHSEDLLFYLSIAHSGTYRATDDIVYRYRKGNTSAMQQLKALDQGYQQVIEELKGWPAVTDAQIDLLQEKVNRIMTRSYAKDRQLAKSIRRWWKGSALT